MNPIMQSFDEFKKEKTLVRYIGSEFGTMYFDPSLTTEKKIIIRHLDNKLPVDLLPIYKNLYYAVIEWINTNKKISKYVFMPNLIEVGKDYIVRPFYIYDIAIRDYLDKEDEDYVEPPELFEEMRKVVSLELNKLQGNDGVIQRVLKKSLFEFTGKTIYDFKMNKFIIVEPKIALTDLYEWNKEVLK